MTSADKLDVITGLFSLGAAGVPPFFLILDCGPFIEPTFRAIALKNNTTAFNMCQIVEAIMKRFGEKLRILRKQHELTLKQLGDMLDVHNTYVSQLEKGKKIPNAAMILKISHIFNVSTDKLMKDELELD